MKGKKKRTGKLRRGGTHDSDEGSNVDNGSANTEALGRIGLVLHDFCQYIQFVLQIKRKEVHTFFMAKIAYLHPNQTPLTLIF